MVRYVLDRSRCRVTMEAQSSVHPIHGTADGLEGHVELTVDGGRVDLGSPPSGAVELAVERIHADNRLVELELQRRIEGRRYPTARGEMGDVSELSPGRYRLSGALTFHGVTRTVQGEATVRAVEADRLEAVGELTLDIRDFGLSAPKLFMLKVDPEVRVRLEVVARAGS